MEYRFLVVDKMHPGLQELLEPMKIFCDIYPQTTREEIKDLLPAYDGLIIRSKTPVDYDLIKGAKNLKVVCRAGAGIDNLDVEMLEKANITIINAPEGNRDAVAEHCIGMVLNLFSRISVADKEVKQGLWKREENRGIELKSRTVGIIGYGNMGRALAHRLKGFGCHILAYDKYKSDFGDESVEEASLEDIFAHTDVLSLHIPLTNETRSMVNKDFLNSFTNNFYLINTSRGEVLPLRDLVECMQEGKVLGAGLDVLENEKLNQLTDSQKTSFDSLTQMDNVILTPHVAGWTQESYLKINQTIAEKLRQWVMDRG